MPHAHRRRILLAFLLLAGPCLASDEKTHVDFGGEVQVYPTGVLGGMRANLPLSAHDWLTLRLGGNAADRADNGEHDQEDGVGPGFSVGYRRHLKKGLRGWFLGARVDLWWLEIDWKDNPGTPAEASGSTDVFVVQPTAEAGYTWLFCKKRCSLEPSLALGAEINVRTDGEDVGQGAILLGGVAFGYRF